MKNFPNIAIVIECIILAFIPISIACFCGISGCDNKSKIIKHEINKIESKINKRYCIDEYKMKIQELKNQKLILKEKLTDFRIKEKYTESVYSNLVDLVNTYQHKIDTFDSKDIECLNVLKSQYKICNFKKDTTINLINAYKNGITKINNLIDSIDNKLLEYNSNIEMFEYKKDFIESTKEINDVIQNLNGETSDSVMIELEKINEEFIKENIKLDILIEK